MLLYISTYLFIFNPRSRTKRANSVPNLAVVDRKGDKWNRIVMKTKVKVKHNMT